MGLFESQPIYDSLVTEFGYDPCELAAEMQRYVRGQNTHHHRYVKSTRDSVESVTGHMVILSEEGEATVLPLTVGKRPPGGWVESSTTAATPLVMPRRRNAG